jgi:glutamyl/glutaminyl-tRNA synthetase
MKAYEEIKFHNGYLRWVREGDEYVCRMTEDYMNEMKQLHEREWQGLTDEERYLGDARSEEEIEYAKAIEAKLKEKNT